MRVLGMANMTISSRCIMSRISIMSITNTSTSISILMVSITASITFRNIMANTMGIRGRDPTVGTGIRLVQLYMKMRACT